MSERLYTAADVSRIIGIGASALANRRARTGGYGPDVPEPAYCYAAGRSGELAPLWTRAQIAAMESARAARAAAALDEGVMRSA